MIISMAWPACILASANAFSKPSLFRQVVRSPTLAFTSTWTSLPRLTALNANAKAKSREVELAKLADGLNVSPAKVRELLAGQRRKLDGTEAKARHIDWLLNSAAGQQRPKNGNVLSNRGGAPKPAKKTITASPQSRSITTATSKDSSLLTNVDFSNRSDIHPNSKRALTEVLEITSMTEIQSKTYAAALSGKDVLGRARTGTGKTVAFLLPAIERVVNERGDTGILVISPTRELAMQIGDEAEKLLTFHPKKSVQVVYGGTKVARDVARLTKQLPTVLVATPGRLKDLLKTATVGGRRFSKLMGRTSVIVLDETDQLLDMGFRHEIMQILSFLPSKGERQTLLFSATIPKELKEIMAKTMNDDYVEVDCIQDGADGEVSTQTHIHVKQSYAVIPSMSQYVSSVTRVVKEAVQDDDGDNKIVVFFPTARMVSFFADLFNHVINEPVMELHSKKSQAYRNRVSAQFREVTSGILFTSDVSARGVDYPGVTHVVQFGMPSSREQYIHRLGRTGRAGADGKGWLILGPFESLFVQELKNIDITKNMDLIDVLNTSTLDETDDSMQEMMERVQNGDQTLVKSGEGAYQAFLGYYLGQMKRMRMKRKEKLVEIANEFSGAMGFKETPMLTKNMVGKMGLKGIPGLVVNTAIERGDNNPPGWKVAQMKRQGHTAKPKRKGGRQRQN